MEKHLDYDMLNYSEFLTISKGDKTSLTIDSYSVREFFINNLETKKYMVGNLFVEKIIINLLYIFSYIAYGIELLCLFALFFLYRMNIVIVAILLFTYAMLAFFYQSSNSKLFFIQMIIFLVCITITLNYSYIGMFFKLSLVFSMIPLTLNYLSFKISEIFIISHIFKNKYIFEEFIGNGLELKNVFQFNDLRNYEEEIESDIEI